MAIVLVIARGACGELWLIPPDLPAHGLSYVR